MEEWTENFRPSSIRSVSIVIPKGRAPRDDLADFQFSTKSLVDCSRDFIVQGELLTYYLIIEFKKLKKFIQTECVQTKDLRASILPILENIRFSPKFVERKEGQRDKELVYHGDRSFCVVMHLSEVFANSTTDEPTESDSGAVDARPVEESPAPADPYNAMKTDEFYISSEGQFLYRFQTIVNLPDEAVNSAVTLEVEIMFQPMDRSSSLLGSIFEQRDCYVTTTSTQARLVDPLKAKTVCDAQNVVQYCSVFLENTFVEPIEISSLDFNLSGARHSREPDADLEKLFQIEFVSRDASPILLHPREVYCVVIRMASSLSARQREVMEAGKQNAFPLLFVTWRMPAVSTYLCSRLQVLFFRSTVEQMFVALQVSRLPVTVNTLFSIYVRVSNLANYARSIAVELCLEEASTEFASSGRLAQKGTEESCKALELYQRGSSKSLGIVCSEKVMYLGRAAANTELRGEFRCIATSVGHFRVEEIYVIDNESRNRVRVNLEVLVVP
ncbi:uncharacterized protein LOC126324545 [Schistocerca gregaria]|uniref:uncharacterized protein LOC126324545 n=1 Tax=Schistocerca gregaria TaxID=7010 RepID=UPI00211E377E|nr:uncharacterized protein LOC126324545 [Schistocerca gregaria]